MYFINTHTHKSTFTQLCTMNNDLFLSCNRRNRQAHLSCTQTVLFLYIIWIFVLVRFVQIIFYYPAAVCKCNLCYYDRGWMLNKCILAFFFFSFLFHWILLKCDQCFVLHAKKVNRKPKHAISIRFHSWNGFLCVSMPFNDFDHNPLATKQYCRCCKNLTSNKYQIWFNENFFQPKL